MTKVPKCQSVWIVGYNVYGECSCDVVKVFESNTSAKNYAEEQNKNMYTNPEMLGYIVKEFKIDKR